MDFYFKERECKRGKLDENDLLLPYMVAIRERYPQLWTELLKIIRMAEEAYIKEV